ncbi:hypothetical protein Misp01_61600 [Microtetraspora sp. NBRC 13810]|nr:hypothetical protein Misp01_61600 [Microtetraspora sp. NBRC 13810]
MGLAGREREEAPRAAEAQAVPDIVDVAAVPVMAEVRTPPVPARNARREGELVMVSA